VPGAGPAANSRGVTRLDIDVSQPDRFEVHGRQWNIIGWVARQP